MDSNVIIYASKGAIEVEKLLEEYETFYISIISYLEVYGYEFENEEEKMKF